MKKEIVNLGEISLSGKVRISDPCYDVDTWCAETIEDALPGTYDCFMELSDQGEWGIRVAQIRVCHKDYPGSDPNEIISSDIGVDSGTCGIYDFDYFERTRDDRAWYERVTDATYKENKHGAVHDGKCIVTSSGYGDGCYNLFVDRNSNGLIVALSVEFI